MGFDVYSSVALQSEAVVACEDSRGDVGVCLSSLEVFGSGSVGLDLDSEISCTAIVVALKLLSKLGRQRQGPS